MAETKRNYVGANLLAAALAKVNADGLRMNLFPVAADENKKESFRGFIELPAAEGVQPDVVGIYCYKNKADGTPNVDKNGKPFQSVTVGTFKDQLRGSLFTNSKREGKKDPDFRVLVNLNATDRVESGLWISIAKTSQAKYLNGRLGSRASDAAAAETPPEDAVNAAPAAPATAEAVADPFGL